MGVIIEKDYEDFSAAVLLFWDLFLLFSCYVL